MAFSNQTKREISFKKLVGRDHTTNAKEFFEENAGGGFNVHATEVWSDQIPVPAPGYTTEEVQYFDDFVLTEDITVNNQQGWEALQSGLRLRSWVPPKFGQDYTIRIFSDDGLGNKGEEIASSDPINWFFDYESGFIAVENVLTTSRPSPSLPDIVVPLHMQGYLYIGTTIDKSTSVVSALSNNRVRYMFIAYPKATDSFPLGFEEAAVTIGSVYSETDAGSVDFNIEHRGFSEANLSGTSILTANATADEYGDIRTNVDFSYPDIPTASWLQYVASSVVGSPAGIWLAVSYTIN